MATYEEFTVEQGADLAIELHLVDENGDKKDLQNHQVRAKMKRNYNSDSDVAFSAIIADPAENGVAVLALTNTQTSALSKGRYVYDVEMYYYDSDDNQIIERLLEGRIQVTPGVTKTGYTGSSGDDQGGGV